MAVGLRIVVGVVLGGIPVGVAEISGFINPAEVAAGSSFVLQASTPRARHNPESKFIQRFKFPNPLLRFQILQMDGAL